MFQPTLKNRYKHVDIAPFECTFVLVLFVKTLLSNKGYREEPRASTKKKACYYGLTGKKKEPNLNFIILQYLFLPGFLEYL